PAAPRRGQDPARSVGRSPQFVSAQSGAIAKIRPVGLGTAAGRFPIPSRLPGFRLRPLFRNEEVPMRGFFRLCWVMAVFHLLSTSAPAQQAPAATNAVTATVNGEAIFEKAVQRGLQCAPPDKHAEARPELL